MKKLLAILLIATFTSSVMATPPVHKKPPVKKHKKFDGTKVPDSKPVKPQAKKKK